MGSQNKTPVAIVGATGYTGSELVRLLLAHPKFAMAALTSQQYVGQKFSDVFPGFFGKCDQTLVKLTVPTIAKKVKLAFLCLPHGESMTTAKKFRHFGVRVIDLGADFRLQNLKIFEKVYGPHAEPQLLKEAIYGLPELHREKIRQSKLIANPGCYPTSVILGLAPLAAKKMLAPVTVIVDSKSGVSGAGRGLKTTSLFCEVSDDFKAYAVGQHRHAPEMTQELALLYGETINVCFVPHLLPVDRGILSTMYVKLMRKWPMSELRKIYQAFYRKNHFVTLLPEGVQPTLKGVRLTNDCHVQLTYAESSETLIVTSAIDNLTKGAAGQAIQNANLMMGFKETLGLISAPLIP